MSAKLSLKCIVKFSQNFNKIIRFIISQKLFQNFSDVFIFTKFPPYLSKIISRVFVKLLGNYQRFPDIVLRGRMRMYQTWLHTRKLNSESGEVKRFGLQDESVHTATQIVQATGRICPDSQTGRLDIRINAVLTASQSVREEIPDNLPLIFLFSMLST